MVGNMLEKNALNPIIKFLLQEVKKIKRNLSTKWKDKDKKIKYNKSIQKRKIKW